MADSARLPRLLLVTDPMCSWCWGMAAAVEEAQQHLAGQVRLELLLGGVNLHGTQPIGSYGRSVLARLWAEVAQTTGQPFAASVPEPLVYNSLLPCALLKWAAIEKQRTPLGLLHRMQQRFFHHGANINGIDELVRLAAEFDLRLDDPLVTLHEVAAGAPLQHEFETARSYGTRALPALVLDEKGQRRLLLGGYADAETIVETTQRRLSEEHRS
ncbi:MAG: hypothetical protein AAF648_14845 [Pseudomonadota bacterium]